MQGSCVEGHPSLPEGFRDTHTCVVKASGSFLHITGQGTRVLLQNLAIVAVPAHAHAAPKVTQPSLGSSNVQLQPLGVPALPPPGPSAPSPAAGRRLQIRKLLTWGVSRPKCTPARLLRSHRCVMSEAVQLTNPARSSSDSQLQRVLPPWLMHSIWQQPWEGAGARGSSRRPCQEGLGDAVHACPGGAHSRSLKISAEHGLITTDSYAGILLLKNVAFLGNEEASASGLYIVAKSHVSLQGGVAMHAFLSQTADCAFKSVRRIEYRDPATNGSQ
jgi:hypothetical protein